MFQKLRIKLTLFNIAIIGGILLTIAVVIFWGSPYGFNSSGVTEEMWELALNGPVEEEKSSLYSHISKKDELIYIKLEGNNNIINETKHNKVSDSVIKNVVEKVIRSKEYTGSISLGNGHNVSFLKVVFDKENSSVIVLKDLRESSVGQLRYIKGVMFIIIFSLGLVFIGSLIISKLALKPIKKAYQKQLDFTADASHELRTPLAVIQTNLELVLGNSEETIESQSKWLNNILVENKRMKKLVEDLLTLSRADTNQNILETSKFYIDYTIISVVDLLMPYANEKNITLKVNLKPNVEFLGDKNRIKQLIIILVDNAIKYTESKGTVKVNLDYNDKKIWVSICDTGVGFSDEEKSKIFERFYRLDKTRSRHSGGLGLGLSIAKWIALEHGGSIEVESHIGKGSNFIITLPS